MGPSTEGEEHGPCLSTPHVRKEKQGEEGGDRQIKFISEGLEVTWVQTNLYLKEG